MAARAFALTIGLLGVLITPALGADAPAEKDLNPPLTAKDYAAIGKLPDWSGIWIPDQRDQNTQARKNPPPWKPEIKPRIDALFKALDGGQPKFLFNNCMPEAMPAWMLINHNAMEILFSPGRVTMLGESDSNRLRRIYTDGRPHPEDVYPTFHGHSIGHWEGETLVVDTISIRPQTLFAVLEAVAVPNNGDVHVKERIHLAGKNTLHVELEIEAPKILTGPYKTTRIFYRERRFEIVEGVCIEGDYKEGTDKDGNAVFIPLPKSENGAVYVKP
jgi:hypothetical protein